MNPQKKKKGEQPPARTFGAKLKSKKPMDQYMVRAVAQGFKGGGMFAKSKIDAADTRYDAFRQPPPQPQQAQTSRTNQQPSAQQKAKQTTTTTTTTASSAWAKTNAMSSNKAMSSQERLRKLQEERKKNRTKRGM